MLKREEISEINHQIPLSRCPFCGEGFDHATGFGNANRDIGPKPGDTTVCLGCAAILFFDSHLRVRVPWPGELWIYRKKHPRRYARLLGAQATVRKFHMWRSARI